MSSSMEPNPKMTVLRFPLKIEDYQEISIPAPCQILSVKPSRSTYPMPSGYPGGFYEVQGIDLWLKTEKTIFPKQILPIYIVGAGNPWPITEEPMTSIGIPNNTPKYLEFIDTCVMENNLVWHVFRGPQRV